MTSPLGPTRDSITRRAWLAGVGTSTCVVPGARLLAGDPPRQGWDSGGLELRASLDLPSNPWVVAFSSDGSRLASAGFDPVGGVGPSRVDLWDTATWARRAGFAIPDIRIDRLTFAPDGKTLVAAGLDRASVITCEVATGRCRSLVDIPESGGVPSLSVLSPDGSVLATAGPEGIATWNVADWTKAQGLWGTRDHGYTLATRDVPDWRFTGGWLYAMDRHGIVMGIVPIGEPPGLNRLPPGVQFGGLPWWGLHRVRGVARPWSAKHFTLSPDGKAAAIVALEEDLSARIDLYEIEDDETWRKRTSIGLTQDLANGLDCLAFTPDGRALVGGCGDRVVRFWDVARGGELPPLQGFKGAINALAFSKDGTMMAVTDTQGRSVEVYSRRMAVGK